MTGPTLLERVGGGAAVQAAVHLLYERILQDGELAPFFRGTDMDQMRRHQRMFLERLLSGMSQDEVAAMERAHARLAIEKRHFYRVSDHLVAVLTQLGLAEEVIAEVVSAIAPLARGVVNTPEHPKLAS